MRWIFLCLIICITLGILGCDVDRSEYPGTYDITYKQPRGKVVGKDVLVIKSDGTFTQTLTSANGKKIVNSGTWFYFSDPGYSSKIDFQNLLLYIDDAFTVETAPSAHDILTQIDNITGRIRIVISDDHDLYYIKR